MSGAIAQYWASLGFRIDRKEIRKVDNELKRIEQRIKRFGKGFSKSLNLKFNLDSFSVDQKKLNIALGNALDKASMSVVFEINRFHVNKAALRASVAASAKGLGLGGLGGNIIINQRTLSSAEWDRREAEKQRLWWERRNALRADAEARALERANRPQRVGDYFYSNSTVFGAGGVAGVASRMYMPALTLGLGGYGLGQVNKHNQEVISAQLTTQAVLEAAGLPGQGPQAFEWLRSQGNRIGFNYLDNAQDYNNFLSNSLGAGQSLQESQDIYLGFSEYQRAMGITPARQKLVMNALSQMQGKGVLSMEELRRQMAESLPGTMSIFAQAYQEMTGGSLSGQEAIAALMEAVSTGKVQSSQILPIVARIMRERAAPKLDIAMKTSQAEQARFQNIMSDQAIRASGAGVESGFARLFRSMTIALKEASPLVESMARGFDNISLSVSKAMLSIQSIQRFFQGRDSFLGDKLFPTEESKAKAFEFLESLKTLMAEIDKIVTNIFKGWSMLIEQMSSSTILDKINNAIMTIANAMSALNKLADGDFSGAFEAAKSFAKQTINTITTPGRTGANAILSTFTDRRIPVPFENTDSQLDWATRYKAEQAKMAAENFNKYDLPGINKPLAQGQSSTNLEIKMDVEIRAANPEDFNQQFQERFKSVIQDTLIQYSQKE